MYASVSIPELG